MYDSTYDVVVSQEALVIDSLYLLPCHIGYYSLG